MNRRDFLSRVGAGAAAAVVVPWGELFDRPAARTPDAIAPAAFDQTVHEIFIGPEVESGASEMCVVEIYRASAPTMTVMQWGLSTQSVFRWLAPLGCEIHVKEGDRLLWRQTLGTTPLLVQMYGRNRNRDWVLNQSEIIQGPFV